VPPPETSRPGRADARIDAAVLDAFPLGLYVLDRELRIVTWNAQREKGPLGRPAHDVLGKTLAEIIPPASFDAVAPRLRRIFTDGEAYDEVTESAVNGRIRHFRVGRRPVRQHGEVTHILCWFEDVTAQRETEKTLRMLDKAVQTMQLGVTVTDLDGNILYTNPADARNHGWHPDELLGRHASIFAPSGRRRPLGKDELRMLRSWRRESVNTTKDGRVFPVQLLSDLVTDLEGEPVGLVTTCEDITERKRAEEQIESLAYRDILTGLPNRRLFNDRLQVAIGQAERQRSRLAVMFMDLDGFKLVNDTLGHAWGDELLRNVAGRLESAVRQADTVARLGGDEFTLLLPGLDRPADAERIAEKVLAALRPPFVLGSREFLVTGSMGVALYPEHGRDSESLVRNADAAMYRAKEDGRSHYRVFDAAMAATVSERTSAEAELRRGLEAGEIEVHYQPIVAPHSGTVRSVEALVRWRHPERGLLEPGAFLPVAETTGLILPLGARVLREACETLRAWRGEGVPELGMSVNLSARQFQNGGLVAQLRDALDDTGIPPHLLTLEVAESDSMLRPQQTLATLRELKELGVRILLDDFGVGYSSLSHLKRFPLDGLKIDRCFVGGMPADPDDAAVTRAVARLAFTLGLEVVAKGVETEAQKAFLEELGCHGLQGELFAPALAADDCLSWLRARRDR
jgi:diguanylate cyclase (GGDEF)-like protein/PAS domain S-box-containing protein